MAGKAVKAAGGAAKQGAPQRSPKNQALVDEWHSQPSLPKFKPGNEKHVVEPNTEGDSQLWGARCAKALGVSDPDLLTKLLNQVTLAVGSDAMAANAAVAAVESIGPRDGLEAMLAAQMVATHTVAMDMLYRARIDQPSPQILDSIVSRATKLSRTFVAQAESLTRYRNAGRQQVVVQHQHVAVTADKAAVAIGCPVGAGATSRTEEQPYAPRTYTALAYEPGAALRSEDQSRNTLPVASSEGEKPMPDARRRQG